MRKTEPARSRPASDAPAQGLLRALKPYYVFGRDDGWVSLARTVDPADDALVWAPEESTLRWRHNIVLTFTTSGLLPRALFLETFNDLADVMAEESPHGRAEELREKAMVAADLRLRGQTADGAAVVALGPKKGLDQQSAFHYIPIIDVEEGLMFEDTFQAARGFELSILSARPDSAESTPSIPPPRAGIAFVIDTTKSMQEELDATEDAVIEIVRRISTPKLKERVSFALVGFRDSVAERPEVEYVSRVFRDFGEPSTVDSFRTSMSAMVEAEVSTKGLREDAFAGVVTALDELTWDGIGIRFIVLVTDASARSGGDPLSATGRNAPELARRIREDKAALIALHLLSGDNQMDADRAKGQYEALSYVENEGAQYYPVPGGSLSEYSEAVDRIAKRIIRAILTLRPDGTVRAPRLSTAETPEMRALEDGIARIATAMALDYLGAVSGTKAPDVFTAWALETDYRERNKKPFDVRLLVTRNELSTLMKVVEAILISYEETEVDAASFFDALSRTMAQMALNPDSVAAAARPETIGSMIGLEAIMRDLPYNSLAMRNGQDGWRGTSASEQLQFMQSLESKLKNYEDYYDSKKWIRLHPEDGPEDEVYAMPLDELP